MLYRLAKIVIGPLLWLLFRPRVEGVENIPRQGPVILACNHLSFSDSYLMPLMVPRQVTFIAKAEYFTGRGVKGRLVAGLFKGLGAMPVDRSGARSALEGAINSAVVVLQQGKVFAIYPEGTRSPDGRLYRGRTGVAQIALLSGAPVIPVGMIGTDRVQPPGASLPKVGRVGVRFGPPLDFSDYEGTSNTNALRRQMTDDIMAELARLSGQEYCDTYAPPVKQD